MVAFSSLLMLLSIKISIVSAITSSTASCTELEVFDVIDFRVSVIFVVIVLPTGPSVASKSWIVIASDHNCGYPDHYDHYKVHPSVEYCHMSHDSMIAIWNKSSCTLCSRTMST